MEDTSLEKKGDPPAKLCDHCRSSIYDDFQDEEGNPAGGGRVLLFMEREEWGRSHEVVAAEHLFNPLNNGISLPNGGCSSSPGSGSSSVELRCSERANSCAEKAVTFLKNPESLDDARIEIEVALDSYPSQPNFLKIAAEVYEKWGDACKVNALCFRAMLADDRKDDRTLLLEKFNSTLTLANEVDRNRLQTVEDRWRSLLITTASKYNSLDMIWGNAQVQLDLVHTSAAIEGNQLTVEEVEQVLITGCAGIALSKSLNDQFEVNCLHNALLWVYRRGRNKKEQMGGGTKKSLEDILTLHKIITAGTLPQAGELRTLDVVVGKHNPPRYEVLPECMAEFVEWLNREETRKLHALHKAAAAHFYLVYIHPFVDGNGRVSRMLANWLLIEEGYPPIIVREEYWERYFDSLSESTLEDPRIFLRCMVDAFDSNVEWFEEHVIGK